MSVSTVTNPSFLQMPGFNVALNETPKVSSAHLAPTLVEDRPWLMATIV